MPTAQSYASVPICKINMHHLKLYLVLKSTVKAPHLYLVVILAVVILWWRKICLHTLLKSMLRRRHETVSFVMHTLLSIRATITVCEQSAKRVVCVIDPSRRVITICFLSKSDICTAIFHYVVKHMFNIYVLKYYAWMLSILQLKSLTQRYFLSGGTSQL